MQMDYMSEYNLAGRDFGAKLLQKKTSALLSVYVIGNYNLKANLKRKSVSLTVNGIKFIFPPPSRKRRLSSKAILL